MADTFFTLCNIFNFQPFSIGKKKDQKMGRLIREKDEEVE